MMHNGTTDFLKMVSVLVFIGVAVWWLDGAIGKDYTVLVIFALVGVILFAGGAFYGHVNQKMTLDAITKFNANDSQIDRYRMQSFKAMASGESAMQRAAAQLQVLDAKRITKMADEKAKFLIADQQSESSGNDTWTWDDDGADDNDGFQVWQ